MRRLRLGAAMTQIFSHLSSRCKNHDINFIFMWGYLFYWCICLTVACFGRFCARKTALCVGEIFNAVTCRILSDVTLYQSSASLRRLRRLRRLRHLNASPASTASNYVDCVNASIIFWREAGEVSQRGRAEGFFLVRAHSRSHTIFFSFLWLFFFLRQTPRATNVRKI